MHRTVEQSCTIQFSFKLNKSIDVIREKILSIIRIFEMHKELKCERDPTV